MRTTLLAGMLGAGLALTGCSTLDVFVPTTGTMHDAPPVAMTDPASNALVVFVRPSYFGAIYSLRVVDENGLFVADVPAHTHASVVLPPGKHTFTMLAREVEVMITPKNVLWAELGAGRVYFVYVDVNIGDGPYLAAIGPKSEHWNEVREWMAETDSLAPNGDAFEKSVMGGKDVMEEALLRGKRLSPDERAERTLEIADGIQPRW